MKQVRQGVFETNSSSVHTITICSDEEYNAWTKGELLVNDYDGEFKHKDDINQFSEEQIKQYYNRIKKMFWKEWNELTDDEKSEINKEYIEYHDESEDFKSYTSYMSSLYNLEYYHTTYTTKGGEKMHVFGRTGYDG